MNSTTTTMAFVIITITILVLLYSAIYLPGIQRALASVSYEGFDFDNLPCVLIHGGHVHCDEAYLQGT